MVIAQGGTGAFLGSCEATTERTIALKVILDTVDALVRFLNEAKITAQLEHPEHPARPRTQRG